MSRKVVKDISLSGVRSSIRRPTTNVQKSEEFSPDSGRLSSPEVRSPQLVVVDLPAVEGVLEPEEESQQVVHNGSPQILSSNNAGALPEEPMRAQFGSGDRKLEKITVIPSLERQTNSSTSQLELIGDSLYEMGEAPPKELLISTLVRDADLRSAKTRLRPVKKAPSKVPRDNSNNTSSLRSYGGRKLSGGYGYEDGVSQSPTLAEKEARKNLENSKNLLNNFLAKRSNLSQLRSRNILTDADYVEVEASLQTLAGRGRQMESKQSPPLHRSVSADTVVASSNSSNSNGAIGTSFGWSSTSQSFSGRVLETITVGIGGIPTALWLDSSFEVWLGTRKGHIIVVSAKDGSHIRTVNTPLRYIWSICAHSVTGLVWIGDCDGDLVIVDPLTDKQVRYMKHSHQAGITQLFSNNNYVFSSSSDFTIRVFNQRGDELKQLLGHSNIVRCMVYCNGYIWSGCQDRTIFVWSGESGSVVSQRLGHSSELQSMEAMLVSADEQSSSLRVAKHDKLSEWRVFSGDESGVICMWSPKNEGLINQWKAHKGSVCTLKAVGGELWSGGSDGSVCLWSGKGQLIKRISGLKGWIWRFVVFPGCVWSLSSSDTIQVHFAPASAVLQSVHVVGESDTSSEELELLQGAHARDTSDIERLRREKAALQEQLRLRDSSDAQGAMKLAHSQSMHIKLAAEKEELQAALSQVMDQLVALQTNQAPPPLGSSVDEAEYIRLMEEAQQLRTVLSQVEAERLKSAASHEELRNTLQSMYAEIQRLSQVEQDSATAAQQVKAQRERDQAERENVMKELRQLKEQLQETVETHSKQSRLWQKEKEDHAMRSLEIAALKAEKNELLAWKNDIGARFTEATNGLEEEQVSWRSEEHRLQGECEALRSLNTTMRRELHECKDALRRAVSADSAARVAAEGRSASLQQENRKLEETIRDLKIQQSVQREKMEKLGHSRSDFVLSPSPTSSTVLPRVIDATDSVQQMMDEHRLNILTLTQKHQMELADAEMQALKAGSNERVHLQEIEKMRSEKAVLQRRLRETQETCDNLQNSYKEVLDSMERESLQSQQNSNLSDHVSKALNAQVAVECLSRDRLERQVSEWKQKANFYKDECSELKQQLAVLEDDFDRLARSRKGAV